jgi:hypothetical protein
LDALVLRLLVLDLAGGAAELCGQGWVREEAAALGWVREEAAALGWLDPPKYGLSRESDILVPSQPSAASLSNSLTSKNTSPLISLSSPTSSAQIDGFPAHSKNTFHFGAHNEMSFAPTVFTCICFAVCIALGKGFDE